MNLITCVNDGCENRFEGDAMHRKCPPCIERKRIENNTRQRVVYKRNQVVSTYWNYYITISRSWQDPIHQTARLFNDEWLSPSTKRILLLEYEKL